MEVSYQLNEDDYVAFCQHACRRSAAARRAYRLNFYIVPLLLALWFFIYSPWRYGSWLMVAIFWGPVLLCGLLYMLLYRRFYDRSLKRAALKTMREGHNAGFLCTHRLAIDSDSIVETTDIGEERVLWDGVESVEENDKYIFIYTGSMKAHPIPKWAFETERQAREFFDAAQTFHKRSLAL